MTRTHPKTLCGAWFAQQVKDLLRPQPGLRISSTQRHSPGISLLEIVISIGILGTIMAAVGHIINQGADNAVRTELTSEGIIRCESLLAEVVAGVIPRSSSGQAAFSDNSAWTWEVAVSPAPREDLELIEVTVRHQQGEKVNQVVKLARWIRTAEAMQSTTTGGTDAAGL